MLSSFRTFDRCIGPASVAVLALVGGLSLAAPARALDDDGRENVFTSVMGLLQLTPQEDQPDIDYRERAPLVLPPKAGLPPPAPEPERAAAWPNDPDVLRRKEEAAKLRMPAIFNRVGNSGRLTREQLAAGRAPAVTPDAPADNDMRRCGKGQCVWLDPEKLKAAGAKTKTEESTNATVAGVEPDRRFLTDPPKGYRKATRTVKATNDGPAYDASKENVYQFFEDLNPFKKSDDD